MSAERGDWWRRAESGTMGAIRFLVWVHRHLGGLASRLLLDATVAYIAARSPISNTLARYQNAVDNQREPMIANNKTFFKPWESITESHRKAM